MAWPMRPSAKEAAVPAVELRGLRLAYDGAQVPALDGIDLVVRQGELVTLLGPSGCGKSTLLRVVAGLETPQAGRVVLGGQDCTGLAPSDRPVALVFQHYALFPHLGVADNVAYGLRAARRNEAEVMARTARALALLGLQDLAGRRPAELSGGQQQRVALARALVVEPQVLLLDEPLSNLDRALRRVVRDEIRELQRRLHLTVLYVTHDQDEALAVSDRIVVMQQGRVAQHGSPRALYGAPVNAFVAGFMGDARLFDAEVDTAGCLRLGPLAWPAPAGLRHGPVTLVLRPEAWRLGPASQPGLPATVLRAAYLGRSVEYTLATDLGELMALSSRAGRRHEVGAPLSLTLGSEGVAVLPVPPPQD